MNSNQLLALIYADIFNFPLTKEELNQWGIRPKKINSNSFIKFTEYKNNFFFLKGRSNLIGLRKAKKSHSKQKIIIARKVCKFLKLIPTIKMIAITGNLAMMNAGDEDDIDFLVVTSKGFLWTTRLLTLLLVDLQGQRRHPNDKKFKDKICLNMFMDEENLVWPVSERNLYTAHEICQLRPIFDRGGIYKSFITGNKWVLDFLPKAAKIDSKITLSNRLSNENYIEKFFRLIQLFYMKKKITKEKITKGMLRFHPQDKSNLVVKQFKKRVENYLNITY